MTTTTNLLITHIETAQSQKEVTANEAFEAFDDALSESLAVDVTSGNATITAAQITRALLLKVDGADTPGRTVTVPQGKRLFLVESDASNTEDFTVVRGATSITIAAGEVWLLHTDGSANGLRALGSTSSASATSFLGLSDTPATYSGQAGKQIKVNSGETALEFVAEPFIAAGNYNGVPTASVVVLRLKTPTAFTLPQNLTGSQGVAEVAATAQTDFDIQKNGSSIGTMRFAASGTVPSFIFSSAVSFAAGDRLKVIAPATPDATLADIAFSLLGTR